MTQNGIQFNKALVLNDLWKYWTGPILNDDPKSNMFKHLYKIKEKLIYLESQIHRSQKKIIDEIETSLT